MSEPIWLETEELVDMHAELIALFGGPPGIRDLGLVRAAVDRQVARWRSRATDGAGLAAGYACDLAHGRAFVDGNKRIAFQAMMVFLRLNDLPIAPKQPEATAMMLAIEAGEVSERGLARWIRDHRRKA
jgi:death-on-curing protein